MAYTFKVNEQQHTVDLPGDMPLLWVLRDELNLLGTKFGCGIGQCGACTVHLDGVATRSCSLPLSSIGTAQITTIEHMANTPVGAALQAAWIDQDVMQCGYCQAGQIMTAAAALAANAKLDRAGVTAALEGNLCRCGCYDRIGSAVLAAAKTLHSDASGQA